MSTKISLQGILSVLIIAILASCGATSKKSPTGAGGPLPGPMPYKVAPVYFGEATIEYSFPATIEGEQNVEIRPKVDGFVQKIFVDEGAVVRKGQALFQLSNPQYEQAVRSAVASVKIAQANVLSASMDVEKVRPLVEKNIISKYELQSNEYTLESRKSICKKKMDSACSSSCYHSPTGIFYENNAKRFCA